MKQQPFEHQHTEQWQALDELLAQLERNQASPADCEGFSHRYRRLCHHLALARQRGYSSHLVDRLEQLAMRGHQQLYRHRSRVLGSIAAFVLAGLPDVVRAQWRWVAAATVLLLGAMLVTLSLVYRFPDLIYAILDPQQVQRMEAMYDPGAARFGPAAEHLSASAVMMFGYYVMHNVGIAFQVFAGGLLLGLGSLYTLMSNGLSIGAVAGHLSQIGYAQTFWPFVIGHGAFELPGIVLAGAAGLRLGGALLAPGPCSRAVALRSAAQVAMQLVYGSVLLLLLAAFIEAFWSSRATTAASVKYSVGVVLWVIVLGYLGLAGRHHARK